VNVEGVVTPSTARFYPVGETDSEIAACLLLERMATRWNGTTVPSLPARLGIVSEFAAEMRELGPANFLYSDSDVLFAHGHRRTQADGSISPPGLGMLHRRCAVDPDALAAAGVRLTEKENSQVLILFASVPLT
jgi:predicted glutamine amidotransferase